MSGVKSGRTPYWVFYLSTNHKEINNCGKWMHFFSKGNYQFAKDICTRAIKGDIVSACKHTSFEKDSLINPLSTGRDVGVICFYINGTSNECHKRTLDFMIRNKLIQKTKSDRFFNIGFKFDSQTLNYEYGESFTPQIKLDDFVDLDTGKFLENK